MENVFFKHIDHENENYFEENDLKKLLIQAHIDLIELRNEEPEKHETYEEADIVNTEVNEDIYRNEEEDQTEIIPHQNSGEISSYESDEL